jgi:hypothetical protein
MPALGTSIDQKHLGSVVDAGTAGPIREPLTCPADRGNSSVSVGSAGIFGPDRAAR